MKQIARKKADKTHSDREYRKLASKTGGGHLPPLPPEEDPDDGNDLDIINDSVPIETGFNELVRPQDRVTSLAGGSCTPRHDTPLSMARSRLHFFSENHYCLCYSLQPWKNREGGGG